MRDVIAVLFVLVAVPVVLRQMRKPWRGLGRPFLTAMNVSHSALTDWALAHLRIDKQSSILDIGCGGGRTVAKLAALAPEGHVDGIDYSPASVAVSRATNATLIAAGRVDIQQASVSKLPFPDGKFDLVTAIETQYYWPDLPPDMREILRALKPGGTLLVVAETYKGGRTDKYQWPIMRLIGSSHLSAEDQRALFCEVGFVHIEIFEKRDKGWICAKGAKPAAQSS
jgi:SAM-dependent methyltransferase